MFFLCSSSAMSSKQSAQSMSCGQPMHSHQTFSSLGAPEGAEGVHSKIVEAGRQSKYINMSQHEIMFLEGPLPSHDLHNCGTCKNIHKQSGGAWRRIYSSSRRPTMNDASMLIVRCVRCRSSMTNSHGGFELFTTF